MTPNASTATSAVVHQPTMNVIREINRINERELELGGDGTKASWHDDYKDSAYVFVGGLPFELTEGDVITIMSQFGEVADINMPRDKETGKPKGFAFVMYEDQRSTVLAVDNLTGGTVLGRTIRVDHVKDYKQPGSRNEEGEFQEPEAPSMNALPPVIGDSEGSTSSSDAAEEDEDPMAAYIRAERKKQKSSKKKEGKESKEERRARKAAKKVRKAEKKSNGKGREEGESRVKREGSEDRKPRIRDTSRRTISRSRSPRRIPKREEEEEDTKPSRVDLSRSREEIRPFTDRQRDRERRSRTPEGRGVVKRERSPSAGETRWGGRQEPNFGRDPSPRRELEYREATRDRSPRRDRPREREFRDAPRDRSPRRDSRARDFDNSSRRRTDQDWRSGREEPLAIDDRAGEADYASWRGKREVERVMKRVGGEREKRW